MYLHTQQLINEIVVDEPDPAAANALQEGLGGQFGEMRTMMQYLFQAWGARGPKKYRDMILATGTEEIGHIEMLATAVALNLEGAPTELQEAAARDGEPVIFVLSQEDLLGQRGAPGAILANALLSGMRTLAAEGVQANAVAVGPDTDPEDLQHWIAQLETGRGVTGELVRVHAKHVGKIQV